MRPCNLTLIHDTQGQEPEKRPNGRCNDFYETVTGLIQNTYYSWDKHVKYERLEANGAQIGLYDIPCIMTSLEVTLKCPRLVSIITLLKSSGYRMYQSA